MPANHRFTIQPHNAAIEVYKSLGGSLNNENINAPSGTGALMRIAPLALSENYLAEINEHCTTTHFDGRCVASCLLQCEMIRHLLKRGCITEHLIKSYGSLSSTILGEKFSEEFKTYFDIGMNSELLPCDDRHSLNESSTHGIFSVLKVGAYSGCNKNGYTLLIWFEF